MIRPDTPSRGYMNHPGRRLVVLASPRLAAFRDFGWRYESVLVDGWGELMACVEQEPPSSAVLLDPFAGADAEPDPRLAELLRRTPSVPVVAAVEMNPWRVGGARRLLEWGVSELADLGVERTPAALLPRLRAAHARPLKRLLEPALSRYVSAPALTLLRAAAEVVVDGGGRTELAGVFGVGERTLAGWCAREGLPHPRRLFPWMRVLLALSLLEEPKRSVLAVARVTGYVDYRSLGRAVRQLTGDVGLATTRGRSFAEAAQRFDAELREMRERVRERKRRARLSPDSTASL